MSNLYSERAESLHDHAHSMMEAFRQLYDNSKSTGRATDCVCRCLCGRTDRRRDVPGDGEGGLDRLLPSFFLARHLRPAVPPNAG